MEGKIDMAARRQVTNKLRDAYCKGSKAERGRILDRVAEATGMGRSTAGGYCAVRGFPRRRIRSISAVSSLGRMATTPGCCLSTCGC